MPNAAFLSRGRRGPATVELAAPDPTAGQNHKQPVGLSASANAAGVTFEGRLSLGILTALVVALIAFYLWTRNAQG